MLALRGRSGGSLTAVTPEGSRRVFAEGALSLPWRSHEPWCWAHVVGLLTLVGLLSVWKVAVLLDWSAVTHRDIFVFNVSGSHVHLCPLNSRLNLTMHCLLYFRVNTGHWF